MKYSAAFAWENKLLNGLQMQPVFLSLLRMTYHLVIAKPCKRLQQSVPFYRKYGFLNPALKATKTNPL